MDGQFVEPWRVFIMSTSRIDDSVRELIPPEVLLNALDKYFLDSKFERLVSRPTLETLSVPCFGPEHLLDIIIYLFKVILSEDQSPPVIHKYFLKPNQSASPDLQSSISSWFAKAFCLFYNLLSNTSPPNAAKLLAKFRRCCYLPVAKDHKSKGSFPATTTDNYQWALVSEIEGKIFFPRDATKQYVRFCLALMFPNCVDSIMLCFQGSLSLFFGHSSFFSFSSSFRFNLLHLIHNQYVVVVVDRN